MFKSKSQGMTVYQGRLWSLSGSDITIIKEGSKNSPPTKRVIPKATQEVLKGLYEQGHKSIYIDMPKVAPKIAPKQEEEE